MIPSFWMMKQVQRLKTMLKGTSLLAQRLRL